MVKKDKVLSPFFANLSIGLNRWDFFKTSGELFIDSDELSQVIETDNHVAADFGMPVRNRGILSGGFSYGMLDYRYFQTAMVGKNDIADRTVLNYSSLHGTFEYNTLNFKQYASEGAYFKTQIRYITGLEEYSPGTSVSNLANERAQKGHSWINLTAVRERYFKLSHHVNLGYRGSLNLSDKSVFLNSISSLLSSSVYAPFPQSKTLVLEKFGANNLVGFGVIPMLLFSDEMQVRAEVHIFQPYKYIYTRSFETTYSKPFPTPRYMGNLSVVYQTPIGPLAVTGSFFYKEEIPFYFQVNLGYVLFNKKGLE
jgi:NTE family protein